MSEGKWHFKPVAQSRVLKSDNPKFGRWRRIPKVERTKTHIEVVFYNARVETTRILMKLQQSVML